MQVIVFFLYSLFFFFLSPDFNVEIQVRDPLQALFRFLSAMKRQFASQAVELCTDGYLFEFSVDVSAPDAVPAGGDRESIGVGESTQGSFRKYSNISVFLIEHRGSSSGYPLNYSPQMLTSIDFRGDPVPILTASTGAFNLSVAPTGSSGEPLFLTLPV